MQLNGWGHSETGSQRETSEDRIAIDPRLGFFMVADGMGNGTNGGIAAQLAIDVAYARVRSLLADRIAESDPFAARERLRQNLSGIMNEASEAIFRRAQGHVSCHGMATTASLIQIVSGFGVIAHIGDSRIYLLRGGLSYQLTEDHTLLQELLRSGSMPPEAAAAFPHRNVLSRALGKSPTAAVDSVVVDVVPGDRLVLCSDGLTDHVSADEIARLVGQRLPNTAAPELVALGRQRGGDDVSVVVVDVGGAAARPTTLPTQDKASLLGQVFLCKDLTFQEVVRVLAVVQERRVTQGTVIIREGDIDGLIYLLAVGRASVSRGGLVHKELTTGDHFGELALIGSGRHTITVTAAEESVLLTLAKADVYNLVRSDHGIAIKLLWGFLTKLSETVEEQARVITMMRSGH